MRNTVEEAQARIKIARQNINNLRYADDTILMAESEEELKSLSMKVKKESEKVGLKLNIQETKIMASGPITSWEVDRRNKRNSERLYFLGLQNHSTASGKPSSILGWRISWTEKPGELQSMGLQTVRHD